MDQADHADDPLQYLDLTSVIPDEPSDDAQCMLRCQHNLTRLTKDPLALTSSFFYFLPFGGASSYVDTLTFLYGTPDSLDQLSS